MTDDGEDELPQVEQRLRQARERVAEVMAAVSAGDAGWTAYHGAYREQVDAERRLAELRGEEYAIEIDLGWAWDAGAPLPHLLASERKVYIVCYLREPVPGWDGTWVQVVDPAAEGAVPLGVVEFMGVHSVKFGGPNDEVIQGHPLSGKGLASYSAHRVVNSRWITQEEQINSVHPMHRGYWHDWLNHYLFCFHDSTFECLATDVAGQQRIASLRDLLHELADRLLD